MVEKKLVVDGIRFTYQGMFDAEEFFKEVDSWTDANGFERETKKKLQHVEAEGIKVDHVYELWKNVADYAKVVVRLRAMFNEVVDFDLERNGLKRNMQKGKVLVLIDGFLEQDIEARWQEKPWYVLVKTAYDKLIWKFWMGRFDGAVASNCYSLYNQLLAYFKRYKY